ncbi:hypothetical protein D3C71_2166200 [compost metagenome]
MTWPPAWRIATDKDASIDCERKPERKAVASSIKPAAHAGTDHRWTMLVPGLSSRSRRPSKA